MRNFDSMLFAFPAIALVALISCSSADHDKDWRVPKPGPAIDVAPGVYVAGYVYDAGIEYPAIGGEWPTKAMLWRDGQPHRMLENGGYSSYASALYITDEHEYVAGVVYPTPSGPATPTLWIDGVGHQLDSGGLAAGVYVSGGECRVVGDDYNFIRLWTESGRQSWPAPGVFNPIATDVAVSDGKVYVAGSEHVNARYVATLWTDGVAKHLCDDGFMPNGPDSIATSVFVSSGDVYVSGRVDHYGQDFRPGPTDAVLWENGAMRVLTAGTDSLSGTASSVYVSGGVVRVVGVECEIEGTGPGAAQAVATFPVVWENGGSPRRVPAGPEDPRDYLPVVLAFGDSVYVVCLTDGVHSTDAAAVWKDGEFLHELQVPGGGNWGIRVAGPRGVFVKK